mmetsp:Transcript_37002/g.73231  ORF Transcript_37002/g.73231 Transcript_37002/m.73231 type:complete len:288 (+) Transcript_37002:39-902(+)
MLGFLSGQDAAQATQGSDAPVQPEEMMILQRIHNLEQAEKNRRFERNAFVAEADSKAIELFALRKRVDSLEVMADRILAELAQVRKEDDVRVSLGDNADGVVEDKQQNPQIFPKLDMDATHLRALTDLLESNFVKISDFLAWVKETHEVIRQLWQAVEIIPESRGGASGVLDDRKLNKTGVAENTTAICQRLQQTVQTLRNSGVQMISPASTSMSDSTSRWERHRMGTADASVVGSPKLRTEQTRAATASEANEGRASITMAGTGVSHSVERRVSLRNTDSQSEPVE